MTKIVAFRRNVQKVKLGWAKLNKYGDLELENIKLVNWATQNQMKV